MLRSSGTCGFFRSDRRAQADHGIYDAKKSTIVLDGNPKVFQNSDTISGKIITYYLDEDKSEVTSGRWQQGRSCYSPEGERK